MRRDLFIYQVLKCVMCLHYTKVIDIDSRYPWFNFIAKYLYAVHVVIDDTSIRDSTVGT